MPKTVVRCAKCQMCVAYLPAGFTASDQLICTRTDDAVDVDNGCTFGIRGKPIRGAVPYDVSLDSTYRSGEYDVYNW